MAETKARFLANLIGADNTANDFTLPNTAVSGTNNKVLTSDGQGAVTWETTEMAPETTSISPNEVASADDQTTGGNQTFTLTGENYADSGMTVHFLAGNSTSNDITSGMTVTHTNSTTLSVVIARSAFVDTNEPYSIKVTKSSGLSHTLADALRVDNAPSWSTYVGTLSGSPPVVASIMDNISSATHATLSAVDADGDTVTYSEHGTDTLTGSGSGKAGMTLNSSTGAITGTPPSVDADTNYDFTARATSTGDGGATTKTTDQNFRFTITNFVPQLFAGLAYQADGSSSKTLNFSESSGNFQPDMIWIKNRDHTGGHTLLDSVRGWSGSTKLAPYDDDAQNTGANDSAYGYVSGVTANSMTLSRASTSTNCQVLRSDGSTHNKHMAFAWKAGGQPSGSLGDISSTGIGAGTITGSSDTGWSHVSNASSITQSVNQVNGFSITKFTGSGSGCEFPHNLGGTPDFIIIKNMDEAQAWSCWHKDLSGDTGYRISLNIDNAELQESPAGSGKYFPTAPSSTTIYCGSDDGNGGSTDNFICYAWKAVAGVSCFSSHTSGFTSVGSSLGVNGNCGFQPRFVMIKRRDASGNWAMFDSIRGSGSDGMYYFEAESTAEDQDSSTLTVNFQSNGFTTPSNPHSGIAGATNGHYISIAFA